jgi:hypothetical protein
MSVSGMARFVTCQEFYLAMPEAVFADLKSLLVQDRRWSV